MAELVLVLALFEKLLQQLFYLSLHGSFLKAMESLDRHSQLSSQKENFVYGFLRYQPKAKKVSGFREKILISVQEERYDTFQQQRGDRQNGTQDEDLNQAGLGEALSCTTGITWVYLWPQLV